MTMQHGTLQHSTSAIAMTSPVMSVCTWNLVLAPNGASCTSLQRVIFSKKSLLGNISRCADKTLQTATFAPFCCSWFTPFILDLCVLTEALQLYRELMHSLQHHLVCIPCELSATAMAVSREQQHRLRLNTSVLIGLPWIVVQLYVTDDDIVQTSASISRSFALMQQYGLLLAQPSLCSPFESATWQNPLYKDARLILQYTTFVEIMVPMFNMNFFTSKVIATLEHAETGMP